MTASHGQSSLVTEDLRRVLPRLRKEKSRLRRRGHKGSPDVLRKCLDGRCGGRSVLDGRHLVFAVSTELRRKRLDVSTKAPTLRKERLFVDREMQRAHRTRASLRKKRPSKLRKTLRVASGRRFVFQKPLAVDMEWPSLDKAALSVDKEPLLVEGMRHSLDSMGLSLDKKVL
jgi:hypothetical protein